MARDISCPVCCESKNAELERLQVLVHPVAQVVLDAERHPARHEPARHAEHQPQHAGARHGERERPEVGARLVDVVDRAADEVRHQHAGAHRGGRQHERQDHPAPVGAQEAEQSPEGLHRPSTLEPYFCFAGALGGKENSQVMGRNPAPVVIHRLSPAEQRVLACFLAGRLPARPEGRLRRLRRARAAAAGAAGAGAGAGSTRASSSRAATCPAGRRPERKDARTRCSARLSRWTQGAGARRSPGGPSSPSGAPAKRM